MHTLFLLNPTAGKTDCTRTLPQQIEAAAARAGLAPEAIYHSGHHPRRSRPGACECGCPAGPAGRGDPAHLYGRR